MNQVELKSRTKKFGIRIIKLVDAMPNTIAGREVGKQVLRSSLSVGSNYRAACRARSKADFISTICVVEEEADETLFWLEVIEESELIKQERLAEIKKEADEIVAIFTSIAKTSKERYPKNKK